jgi:hypothetical protein
MSLERETVIHPNETHQLLSRSSQAYTIGISMRNDDVRTLGSLPCAPAYRYPDCIAVSSVPLFRSRGRLQCRWYDVGEYGLQRGPCWQGEDV